MALTPISLFQSQGNGIAQFLQGGQSALASALNNVIQVGRDTVNKQFAQERDFLSEQKRVEDLAQRRGENLQQQSNFDRTFARNLFVTDREFADRNDDQARAEKRMDAQDLFRQTDADRNYDLRKSEAESLQESRDLAIKEAERQAEERRKQEQFDKDILARPTGPGLPGAPVQERSLTANFLYAPTDARSMETAAPGTPEERLAEADIRMKAAEGKDADAYTKAARDKAAAEAEIKRAGGGDITDAEARSQERFLMAKRAEERTLAKEAQSKSEKAAEQERKLATAQIEGILTDPKAFPFAQSFVPEEGLSKEEQAIAKSTAESRDSNRALIEVQAALDSPTFDDYLIKAVPDAEQKDGTWRQLSREEKLARAKALGPEVIKKRKKLYTLARKTGLDGEAAPAPAAATTPAASEVERLLGGRSKLAD